MLPRRLQRLPASTLADGAVIHTARSVAVRLFGLALLRDLPFGHALFFADCRSLHTFGMRFDLDIAFLDERGHPIRVERAVPRRRVLTCRQAFAALECRAGEIDRFLGGGSVG